MMVEVGAGQGGVFWPVRPVSRSSPGWRSGDIKRFRLEC